MTESREHCKNEMYIGRAKRRLVLTLWEVILFEKAGFQEGRDFVVQEDFKQPQEEK